MDSVSASKLRDAGVDPEEAIRRCGGNEALYLRLLGKFVDDGYIERVEDMVDISDVDGAEKVMHELKGVAGNLSLYRLAKISNDMDTVLKEGKMPSEDELGHWRTVYMNVINAIGQVL